MQQPASPVARLRNRLVGAFAIAAAALSVAHGSEFQSDWNVMPVASKAQYEATSWEWLKPDPNASFPGYQAVQHQFQRSDPDSVKYLSAIPDILMHLPNMRIVDSVMDQQEKRVLSRTLPGRSGAWQFKFDIDKMTDEERVQALSHAEGAQAKYEVTVACGSRGSELLISAFEIGGTAGKQIPRRVDALGAYEDIRLRIDSNPALGARLKIAAYENKGQVDIKRELANLLRSSRMVFADVFPGDQVEIATAFPVQFTRLCQLLNEPPTAQNKSDSAASGKASVSTSGDAVGNLDELAMANPTFVQSEVLLRPGISDLPGVSVREFLERILRTQMDRGQQPRIVQISKRNNEYTIDIQFKNRAVLVFSHILSAPANGRAALLQSVVMTVTSARGQKVDPPYEFPMDPLEFATFMAAVPGFN